MGFALPAAIGAKIACPDKEVWVIVGDGGFQMTAAELATIVQEKLDINIAIINNGYLGMVRQWQEFFYEKNYAATPILSPDFVKLAEAHGIDGAHVSQAQGCDAHSDQSAHQRQAVPDQFPGGEGRRRLPDDPARRRAARDGSPAGTRSTARDCGGRIMLHTFVALVEDKPGVLTRVASLFRRLNINIVSLTVGESSARTSRA